jgi:hypothetical protein
MAGNTMSTQQGTNMYLTLIKEQICIKKVLDVYCLGSNKGPVCCDILKYTVDTFLARQLHLSESSQEQSKNSKRKGPHEPSHRSDAFDQAG